MQGDEMGVIYWLTDATNLNTRDAATLKQYLNHAADHGRSLMSGQMGNLDSFLNFLLAQNIKGAVLLRFIEIAFNGSGKKFIQTALDEPSNFQKVFNNYFYQSPEQIKRGADESLKKCLDVI